MVGGRRTPKSFLAKENRQQLGHSWKQAETRGGDCGTHTRLPFPRTQNRAELDPARPGDRRVVAGQWPWPTMANTPFAIYKIP